MMKKMRAKRSKDKFRVNLEVFEDKGEKVFKISNMPLPSLEIVSKELLKKFK